MTRRHGGAEKHAENIFRISFSPWNAAQESQNLRARSQRRSYGFAARRTPGWKVDNRREGAADTAERFSCVLGMLSSLGGASPPPNLMEVKG